MGRLLLVTDDNTVLLAEMTSLGKALPILKTHLQKRFFVLLLFTADASTFLFPRILVSPPELSLGCELGDESLQGSGCCLLRLICDCDLGEISCKREMVISSVMDAMLAHSDQANIQVDGLNIIKQLGNFSEKVSIITRRQSKPALLIALYSHLDNARVTSEAISVLNAARPGLLPVKEGEERDDSILRPGKIVMATLFARRRYLFQKILFQRQDSHRLLHD
jgi:hypothetical protein